MSDTQPRSSKKRKQVLIISLAIIVALTVDLTITGYLKFGYYVIRCGGIPVKIIPGAFTGRATYELPGNYTPGWANSDYYCTEQEVIDIGFPKGMNTKFSEFKRERER